MIEEGKVGLGVSKEVENRNKLGCWVEQGEEGQNGG